MDKEPEVFLRDGRKNVEIVIRMHSWSDSDTLLSKMTKRRKESGLTLAKAFDDILWKKLPGRKNTAGSELARPATEAYRAAWLQFFTLLYVGHFHPEADSWLKAIKDKIDSETKATDRGRRATTQAESKSLIRRFQALWAKCQLIHHAAEEAATAVGDSRDTNCFLGE